MNAFLPPARRAGSAPKRRAGTAPCAAHSPLADTLPLPRSPVFAGGRFFWIKAHDNTDLSGRTAAGRAGAGAAGVRDAVEEAAAGGGEVAPAWAAVPLKLAELVALAGEGMRSEHTRPSSARRTSARPLPPPRRRQPRRASPGGEVPPASVGSGPRAGDGQPAPCGGAERRALGAPVGDHGLGLGRPPRTPERPRARDAEPGGGSPTCSGLLYLRVAYNASPGSGGWSSVHPSGRKPHEKAAPQADPVQRDLTNTSSAWWR